MPSKKLVHKKRGRRKLSDYNKLQKLVWQLYREQGKKVTFTEASKEISKVYKEFKKLPDNERKFYNQQQAESMVSGLYNYIQLPEIQLPTMEVWFRFNESISSTKGINKDFELSVTADDSENYGGKFEFNTTVPELRKAMSDSGLAKYLNEYNAFRDSDYFPTFKLISREGNKSAQYKLLFNGVDKSIYPTGHEKQRSKEYSSSDNKQLEVEQEKTKQAEQNRLKAEAEDRTKNAEVYREMYKEGLITKEQYLKRMGF